MKHVSIISRLTPLVASVCTLACAETGPVETGLRFSPGSIDLTVLRDTVVEIHNDGRRAVGPIEFSALGVTTLDGTPVTGPRLVATPAEIPTLNPGASRLVVLSIDAPGGTPDNRYGVVLEARLPTVGPVAAMEINFTIDDAAFSASVTDVAITAGPASVRQGDVVRFTARAYDQDEQPLTHARFRWTVIPSSAGHITEDGRFVAYADGTVHIAARAGNFADTVSLSISERAVAGTFTTLGHGAVSERFTSDLWVRGGVAYTGTWGVRTVNGTTRQGNTLYTWDVTDPGNPLRVGSVGVDARVVNDVKISADGRLGVITHEGSGDGRNGITLLDLADPLHPTVITRFTSELQTGVHNAWLQDGYVYLVVDGISPTSGLRILDITNPNDPKIAASFYGGSSFLHDVYVRDGLAFLSHWDAGLIVLDVGNGIAGGTPDAPVEVSRIHTAGGQAHNAWYWPDAGYVFVGEEDFGTPGIMHVIDVSNLSTPREVATFGVMGTTPHNFWLDEDRAILYLAWYTQGIRALDVSGELLGSLDRQGREIAGFQYSGASGGCFNSVGTASCNWAPQLDNGLLYLSDGNTGLWVLQPGF
jgi:hypothetical protein